MNVFQSSHRSRHAITRTIIVAIIAVIVIVAGVTAYLGLNNSASTNLVKINVATGTSTAENTYWPILMGQQQGIFQKHGLEVTWTPYSGGGPMYQAVAAGSASLGLAPVITIIQERAQGVPMKCLAVYTPKAEFDIYVSSDSTIKGVTQLNGKTVGVSALGGLEQLYFELAAHKANITLKYTGTGGSTQSVALLKTGRISAFIFTINTVLSLVAGGQIRSIYNVLDAMPSSWQNGDCVFSTDQYIQQNPDTVRKFVAATLEATQYVVDNPSAAAQIYTKQTNATQAIAQQAYSNTPWQSNGSISVAGLQSMESTLTSAGLIKNQAPPVNDLYDASFLPKS